MKCSGAIRLGLFLGAGMLMLHPAPVLADDPKPAEPAMMQRHGFDWVEHTQQTLDELKGKLNLAPGQMAAWETWSAGVLKDAHQHLQQREAFRDKEDHERKPPMDLTTPEQMARGVERLRARLNWMQEHLAQLEAAQGRTKAFYDTLDTNQKTIFDLFWHEMYHRMAGHDGWGMHREGGFGPGPMDEGNESPCCER